MSAPAVQPATMIRPADPDSAYRFLQRLVGFVALLFSPLIIGGDHLIRAITDESGPMRGSVSAYYYGRTGNVFVGALCALALFFFSYEYPRRDGWRSDRKLSIVAGFSAIGVAIFPTLQEHMADQSTASEIVGKVHISSAGVLFVCLGILSMWFFTKTSPARVPWRDKWWWLFRGPDESALTVDKRRRNLVYRVCGRVIFACIVGMLVVSVLKWRGTWFTWFEIVAILAFAVSWLVKGFRPYSATPGIEPVAAPADA